MEWVRCGVTARNNGTAFYTFPFGCRIKSRSLSRRTMPVEIPLANGVVDIGDGKISKGSLEVVGRIFAASAEQVEWYSWSMELALAGRDNQGGTFYVWTDRDGTDTPAAYPVTGCTSISTTAVDGTGGVWLDIAVTFIRNGVAI